MQTLLIHISVGWGEPDSSSPTTSTDILPNDGQRTDELMVIDEGSMIPKPPTK